MVHFTNASKNLKCSIERNLSTIKWLIVNNEDILYAEYGIFKGVLELYMKIKEKQRSSEKMNEVQLIKNRLKEISYQIHWALKTDDLYVLTFLNFPLFQ